MAVTLKTAPLDAEYIEMQVSRSTAPASTTGGQFYLRVVDECKPLVGADIQRLLTERTAQPWETLTSLDIPRERTDPAKVEALLKVSGLQSALSLRSRRRVIPSYWSTT